MSWTATLFNSDIAKWDVSSVGNMDQMFTSAASFQKQLCGAAWLNSQATKNLMFEDSSGSRSSEVCAITAFAPHSYTDLHNAVDACFKSSTEGDCPDGSHGPIGKRDVSKVTEMNSTSMVATSVNGDISKWDVSKVKNMGQMFMNAKSLQGDISNWDVSSAKRMSGMFSAATSFNGDISRWDVSRVKDMSAMLWAATSFNGDISKWDVSRVTSMWDVSRVKNMDSMFTRAKSRKQQLCGAAWVRSKAGLLRSRRKLKRNSKAPLTST